MTQSKQAADDKSSRKQRKSSRKQRGIMTQSKQAADIENGISSSSSTNDPQASFAKVVREVLGLSAEVLAALQKHRFNSFDDVFFVYDGYNIKRSHRLHDIDVFRELSSKSGKLLRQFALLKKWLRQQPASQRRHPHQCIVNHWTSADAWTDYCDALQGERRQAFLWMLKVLLVLSLLVAAPFVALSDLNPFMVTLKCS